MFETKIDTKAVENISAKKVLSVHLEESSEAITILPPTKSEEWTFAEEILEDLIRQGYSGKELLAEFKKANRQVRPAVEALIAEADREAEVAVKEYVDRTESIFCDE